MAREFLKQQEVDRDEATEEQWQAAYVQAKQIVEDEHKEVVSLVDFIFSVRASRVASN